MTSIPQSPLQTASTSTFESLALLLPDVVPSTGQLAAPLAHGVRVQFAGPLTGALALHVSDDVARALAANMLGVDAVRGEPADAQRLIRDALGEVANVICGNLLPALAGRTAVFELGAPAPVPVDDPARPVAAITLGIDSGRADVALHLEPTHGGAAA